MSYNTILATTPLTSTGYHLKATGTTIGNSLIWDNGTNVGIGNTNTSYTLDVSGTGRFTGNLQVGNSTTNATLKIYTDSGGGDAYLNFNADADVTKAQIYGHKFAGTSGVLEFATLQSSVLTRVMTLDQNGDIHVGIGSGITDTRFLMIAKGTTSSTFALVLKQSNASTNLLYIRDDGLINTGLAAQSPYNLTIAASANCHIFSDGALFRATSSKRYKTDIEDLSVNTFELINKIRPVWYRSLCERDKKDWSWYGFIAEELAEIDPRFVQFGYASEDYIKDEETNETKLKEGAELRADGVMYDRLTVLLIKGMQEQQIQIQNLQEQINILSK